MIWRRVVQVPLSQMVIVVADLASLGAASPPSIEAFSVVIGCIPLVTIGALLLHNVFKSVACFRQNWCGRWEQADAYTPQRQGLLLLISGRQYRHSKKRNNEH